MLGRRQHTSEMWFHALKCMDEKAYALEVHRPIFGQDGALYSTSRPECVLHFAPWLFDVGPEFGNSILADRKPWCSLCELEIHNGILVDARLDDVAFAILAEIHRCVLRLEVLLVLGELELVQVVRGPHMFPTSFLCKDLAAELCRCSYTPNPSPSDQHPNTNTACRRRPSLFHSHDIAVDDLTHSDLTIVAHHVERLGLDICAAHKLPRQIIFGELGIGRLFRLFGYGVARFWAVVMVCETYAVSKYQCCGLEGSIGIPHASASSSSTWFVESSWVFEKARCCGVREGDVLGCSRRRDAVVSRRSGSRGISIAPDVRFENLEAQLGGEGVHYNQERETLHAKLVDVTGRIETHPGNVTGTPLTDRCLASTHHLLDSDIKHIKILELSCRHDCDVAITISIWNIHGRNH